MFIVADPGTQTGGFRPNFIIPSNILAEWTRGPREFPFIPRELEMDVYVII